MTPFDQFLQFLFTISPSLTIWLLVKILFVVGLALYLAFAVIVIRQVGLMIRTIENGFAGPLKLISWVHFFISIGIFILALVIL